MELYETLERGINTNLHGMGQQHVRSGFGMRHVTFMVVQCNKSIHIVHNIQNVLFKPNEGKLKEEWKVKTWQTRESVMPQWCYCDLWNWAKRVC